MFVSVVSCSRLRSVCVCVSTSLVQAELRAVVQTHVGVTEQAAGGLP